MRVVKSEVAKTSGHERRGVVMARVARVMKTAAQVSSRGRERRTKEEMQDDEGDGGGEVAVGGEGEGAGDGAGGEDGEVEGGEAEAGLELAGGHSRGLLCSGKIGRAVVRYNRVVLA